MFWPKRPAFSPLTWSVLAILAVIGLANLLNLVGVASNEPMLYSSGLGSPRTGLIGSIPNYTVDPNDGWTSQALGHLAAVDWLHGHVPLWNGYEGLGQPLAGEMQSAALFLPFVLLLTLPHGTFLFHLSLELVAGLSTLALLRTMRLSWVASTTAAGLFAVNGSFSLMQNAPFNPIAFLPVTLLGVEIVRRALVEERRPHFGVVVVALGLMFMLNAGFPETAYVEGLFVAGWSLIRLLRAGSFRVRFALWLGAGAVAGVALAAPGLVAFVDFLGYGYTSYHASAITAWAYPPVDMASMVAPYLRGPLGDPHVIGDAVSNMSLSVAVLAVVGWASGRRSMTARIVMLVIATLAFAAMYGSPAAHAVVDLLPGMKLILFYKYASSIAPFAFIVWAAYGLDDLRHGHFGRRNAAAFVAVFIVVAAGLAVAVSTTAPGNAAWTTVYALLTTACAGAVVAAIVWSWKQPTRRLAASGLVAGLLLVQGVVLYSVPQWTASPPAAIDLKPIDYLKANLGNSRFVSLGPISPNYGSYWQLAQLNANDLPVPTKYANYVANALTPSRTYPYFYPDVALNFGPYLFITRLRPAEAQKHLLSAYYAEQPAYRAAAVKYVVMTAGVGEATTAARHSLSRVYSDPTVEIWEDHGASPMIAASTGCAVTTATATTADVRCDQAGTVTRRALNAPGWYVDVNGHTRPFTSATSTFQSVSVPAGPSRVTFRYRGPRHYRPAVALSLATFAGLGCWLLWEGSGRIRRRRVAPVPSA